MQEIPSLRFRLFIIFSPSIFLCSPIVLALEHTCMLYMYVLAERVITTRQYVCARVCSVPSRRPAELMCICCDVAMVPVRDAEWNSSQPPAAFHPPLRPSTR
ncbi:hypothetical protein F5Y14DRAFT_417079 [Nemania sp. NC0429]|nr:hypothetical protein F5Y14DRAFT_417079 [Nemania sp. NC0429]